MCEKYKNSPRNVFLDIDIKQLNDSIHFWKNEEKKHRNENVLINKIFKIPRKWKNVRNLR